MVNVFPRDLVTRFYQEKLDPEEQAVADAAEKQRAEEAAAAPRSGNTGGTGAG